MNQAIQAWLYYVFYKMYRLHWDSSMQVALSAVDRLVSLQKIFRMAKRGFLIKMLYSVDLGYMEAVYTHISTYKMISN